MEARGGVMMFHGKAGTRTFGKQLKMKPNALDILDIGASE
jgi:hypothetical protein